VVMVRATPFMHLFGGSQPGTSSRGCVPVPLATESWGWQIAVVHLPVGHEAASGNAASPSRPICWVSPALAFTVDMGV
jgi:hypothetical protein